MVKISVIIPVYKVEQFVERCIRSVMNQTMEIDIECVIVNDCTPDRSMEIVERMVEEYDGDIHFVLLSHEQNSGIAAVRNTGINIAKGDYVTFIDSDDYVEPDMLEKLYAKAIEENADIVIADYWVTYKDREVYHTQYVPDNKEDAYRELLKGNLKGFNWNKLYRRSLYRENHVGFTKDINIGEDLLFNVELFFYAQKIVGMNRAFLHYVQYNMTASSFQSSPDILKCLMFLDSFFVDFFREKKLEEYFKGEILTRQMNYQKALLFGTKDALQQKISKKYSHITPEIVWRYGTGLSPYWRVAILCVSLHMLPVFNIMRRVWMIMRPALSKRLKFYGEQDFQ